MARESHGGIHSRSVGGGWSDGVVAMLLTHRDRQGRIFTRNQVKAVRYRAMARFWERLNALLTDQERQALCDYFRVDRFDELHCVPGESRLAG